MLSLFLPYSRPLSLGSICWKNNLLACYKLGHHHRHRVLVSTLPLNAPFTCGCSQGAVPFFVQNENTV